MKNHLGAPGEYTQIADPRAFKEIAKHDFFLHNEHLIIEDIMGNIANNYITWQNDGLGTVAEDGMIFLAKRMLQNYERTKNPLDIVRLVWYAIGILRYGKHSIPEATNE